jgi:HSP20 family protein
MAIISPRDASALRRRAEEGALPLRHAIDRLLQDSVLLPSSSSVLGSAGEIAGTNFWQVKDGYLLEVAMPGMLKDSIACTVEQNVLTVTAESALQAPDGGAPLWQSFGGPLRFQMQLPGEVAADQAEATYDTGILTLRLPKTAHARAQTIKVHASK